LKQNRSDPFLEILCGIGKEEQEKEKHSLSLHPEAELVSHHGHLPFGNDEVEHLFALDLAARTSKLTPGS